MRKIDASGIKYDKLVFTEFFLGSFRQRIFPPPSIAPSVYWGNPHLLPVNLPAPCTHCRFVAACQHIPSWVSPSCRCVLPIQEVVYHHATPYNGVEDVTKTANIGQTSDLEFRDGRVRFVWVHFAWLVRFHRNRYKHDTCCTMRRHNREWSWGWTTRPRDITMNHPPAVKRAEVRSIQC